MKISSCEKFIIASLACLALSACGGTESASDAIADLSSPNIGLTGTGANQTGSTFTLYATSAGTVDTTGNTLTAVFADAYVPLSCTGTAFSAGMSSGSCSSLTVNPSTVSGVNFSNVITSVSATSCTDQAVINLYLDTNQVFDSAGLKGTAVLFLGLTVDVAPKVTSAAAGNTAANGSGTLEGTPDYFSIASDNSVVVTFSKSLQNGSLSASLSGCSATLGTPNLVTGSSNKTVAWPLTGFSGFTAGQTCILNVSKVSDAAGNPDDPTDPNLSSTITFH